MPTIARRVADNGEITFQGQTFVPTTADGFAVAKQYVGKIVRIKTTSNDDTIMLQEDVAKGAMLWTASSNFVSALEQAQDEHKTCDDMYCPICAKREGCDVDEDAPFVESDEQPAAVVDAPAVESVESDEQHAAIFGAVRVTIDESAGKLGNNVRRHVVKVLSAKKRGATSVSTGTADYRTGTIVAIFPDVTRAQAAVADVAALVDAARGTSIVCKIDAA